MCCRRGEHAHGKGCRGAQRGRGKRHMLPVVHELCYLVAGRVASVFTGSSLSEACCCAGLRAPCPVQVARCVLFLPRRVFRTTPSITRCTMHSSWSGEEVLLPKQSSMSNASGKLGVRWEDGGRLTCCHHLQLFATSLPHPPAAARSPRQVPSLRRWMTRSLLHRCVRASLCVCTLRCAAPGQTG